MPSKAAVTNILNDWISLIQYITSISIGLLHVTLSFTCYSWV